MNNNIACMRCKRINTTHLQDNYWECKDCGIVFVGPTKGKKHKYNAVKTIVNGIIFDSKKEANYYKSLLLRQREGNVSYFLRQVPFDLPGGIKYRLDFLIFLADGNIIYVDCKGMKTKDYIIKKKQVEALYPVKIEEV